MRCDVMRRDDFDAVGLVLCCSCVALFLPVCCFAVLLCCCVCCCCLSLSPVAERASLYSLYTSAGGPAWTSSINWLMTAQDAITSANAAAQNPCTLAGITCLSTTGTAYVQPACGAWNSNTNCTHDDYHVRGGCDAVSMRHVSCCELS